MIRATLLVLSLAGLVLLAPLVASVPAESPNRAAPTEIRDCQVIDEPGRYVLAEDITGGGNGNFTFASQTCLTIESDDIVLEGRGHKVDGIGVTDTTGITVGGQNASVENVTVSNVVVTDWNRGIYVRNSKGGVVRNATVENNAYGMMIEHASGTNVVRSHYGNDLIGVYEGAGVADTSLSETSYEGNYAGNVVSDTDASGMVRSSDDRATTTATNTNASATTGEGSG